MNREFIHDALSATVRGDVQVHLARAVEEASELTKEVMKALRFGMDNRYPGDGPTNAEKIIAEFGDLRAAIVDAGLVPDRDWLVLYVICRNPSDMPGKHVVRSRIVYGGKDYVAVKPHAIVGSLEEARQTVPAGLARVNRERADDPVIVETWL